MKIKENMVLLCDTANKTSSCFEIEHAERILRMPNNGGWELPINSKYQFNTSDGITIKRNKRDSKKAQK